MRFRTTLFLALILLLGILGVVYLNKQDQAKEETKKSSEKILSYSGDNIIDIQLWPSGIHAIRDSNSRRLLAPIRTDADQAIFDAIASMFDWAKAERVISFRSKRICLVRFAATSKRACCQQRSAGRYTLSRRRKPDWIIRLCSQSRLARCIPCEKQHVEIHRQCSLTRAIKAFSTLNRARWNEWKLKLTKESFSLIWRGWRVEN